MATILTGWREQYERMHRSYARSCVTSAGATSVPSAEARDELFTGPHPASGPHLMSADLASCQGRSRWSRPSQALPGVAVPPRAAPGKSRVRLRGMAAARSHLGSLVQCRQAHRRGQAR